jgi:hypothetical protein
LGERGELAMVLIELVDGRKGKGDVLCLVTANHAPLSFAEWLFLGMHFMNSEQSYYPVEKGFAGKAYLLNCLCELSHGVEFSRVLEKYGLNQKTGKMHVVDRRKKQNNAAPLHLHELM